MSNLYSSLIRRSRSLLQLPKSNNYYCCRNVRSASKRDPLHLPLPKLLPKEREVVLGSSREAEYLIPVEEVIAADESFQSPDYFQVHNLFTVRDLFDARIHLGHQVGSLNSNMKPFLYGQRFDTCIFDLDITAFHLRQALNFLAHIAYRNGIILFITRSPQAINIVENMAIEVGEYAHSRVWESAILTNAITKFGGMTRLPDVIVMMNTLDTILAPHRAVNDAAKMLIPTIGVVDSNCDPSLVTYPIPGNDDTLSAIEFYCKIFKETIIRAKNKRKLKDSQDATQ